MVEEVEELSPEFQAHPFGRTEGRSLENSEIEIHDTLQTKAGIYARLVSKEKASGCEKHEVLNHSFSLDSGPGKRGTNP